MIVQNIFTYYKPYFDTNNHDYDIIDYKQSGYTKNKFVRYKIIFKCRKHILELFVDHEKHALWTFRKSLAQQFNTNVGIILSII